MGDLRLTLGWAAPPVRCAVDLDAALERSMSPARPVRGVGRGRRTLIHHRSR